jgi:exopolyphosphatase/pppGpp-phosphohydrolase
MPQLTREYYQWLYRKYHMSQRRFKDNLNYYEMDPENFSKMYEEVLKNLTEKSAKLKGPGKI